MKNHLRFGNVFNRRRTKSNARRNKHRRFSTVVERLEARNLLAALLVNSTADGFDALPGDGFCDDGGGVCTLRGAIQESNALPGPDTVSVPAGTYALTIPGSFEDGALTGDLDITDDVIVSGAGAGSTIVDASAIGDRVFHIPFTGLPKTVSFLDLTVKGGLATDGGLFLIGSAGGGILSEEPGAVVTLADSVVTENTALGTGFLNGQGGGVAAFAATLTITNSDITNNDAIGDVGAMGRGGGLYTEASTTTLLIDSVISGNQALGGSDTLGFGLPGGAAQGGGIFSNSTTWSMVGSTTVDDNLAQGGDAFPGFFTPGGDALGGGIYSEIGSSWTVTLTPGSTISRNDAIGGDGDFGGNAQGGGIYSSTDSWTIENNTISNNTAVGGGGDPVVGVGGSGLGGGLYTTFGGAFFATFVTIAENDVSGGAGSVAGTGEAGGVFADFLNGASVFLGSTIVAGNTASTLNPDVSGTVFSSGYNLVGIVGSAAGFGMPGDLIGTAGAPIDPMLGPLMINGGPTETHLPMAGSMAIDAADPSVFPAFDQRGVMRPIDGDAVPGAISDIGAVEVAAPMVAPGIDIEKFTNGIDADTTAGQPLIPVGGTATFTYTVTNTGGVPLDNVVVTDSVLGPIAGPLSGDLNSNSILDVGEIWVYTDTSVVTPGQYVNTGSVTADDPMMMPVTDMDDSHHFGVVVDIDVEKATDGADADAAPGPAILVGGTATFTYEVTTGTGNVALDNVQLTDDNGTPGFLPDDFNPPPVLSGGFNIGDTNMDGLLDPGETWQYSATAPVTAGQYENTATAEADDATNTIPGLFTDTDLSHHFGAAPQIAIEKLVSVDGGTIFAPADSPTGPTLVSSGPAPEFKFEVTLGSGTGAVDLDNVVVSDPSLGGAIAGPASGDDGDGILEAGETWVYLATGTWSAGQNTNTGSADGDFTDSQSNTGAAPTATDDANYFGAVPQIAIEKLVSVDGGSTFVDADAAPGPSLLNGFDAPEFKYEVTLGAGTGAVDLDNVSVTDSDLGAIAGPASGDDGDGILEAGETWVYLATGTWAAGQQTNTGSADGDFTDDGGTTEAAPTANDAANYFGAVTGIDLEKLVSVDGGSTFVDADAAPGPNLFQSAALDPEFRFVLTNTGNVGLSNVSLTDTDFGVLIPPTPGIAGGDLDNDGILDTTETWTVEVTGTFALGQHTNTGSVSGDFTDDGGNNEAANKDDDANYFGAAVIIDIQKLTNGVDADSNVDPLMPQIAPGDTVTFDYLVSNLGNVPLSNVEVEDDNGTPLVPGDDFNPPPVLSGGFNVGDTNMDNILDLSEVWEYQFVTTAEDLNVVIDFDTDGLGSPLTAGTIIDTEYANLGLTISADEIPITGMNRAMIFDSSAPTAGDTDLGTPNASFSGPGIGAGGAAGAIGENRIAQGNILIVSDDLIPGAPNAANTGTVTFTWATPVRLNNVHLLDVDSAGANTIDLYDSGGFLISSNPIPPVGNNGFQIVVLNEPFVSKMEVVFGTGPIDKVGIAQIDYDRTFGNLVTGTGQFNPTAMDTDPSHYRNPLEASIDIEKSTQGLDADSPAGPVLLTGTQADFEYVVTNTGDVPLEPSSFDRTQFVVDDNGTPGNPGDDFFAAYVSGDLNNNGILELNEQWIYSASLFPITAGQYTNVGSVEAVDATGQVAGTATDSDTSNHFGADLDIDVEKLVSVDGGATFVDADSITGPALLDGFDAPQFKFIVTNTGNVDLANVTLDDDVLDLNGAAAGTAISIGTLAVGADFQTTITAAWAAGQQTNTASADGDFTDDGGTTEAAPTATDDANYFGAMPQIVIEKLVSVDGGTIFDPADSPTGPTLVSSGPAPEFKFEVTLGSGAGAVDLENVVVSDPSLGGAIAGPASGDDGDGILEAGETWVYLATGTWAAGQQTNTAAADGDFTDDGGTTEAAASATDDANYFGAAAAIDIEKHTNGVDADTPTGPNLPVGSTATFNYFITNTGNVDFDIADVTVTDSDLGVITNIVDQGDGDSLLEVGETWEYEDSTTVTAGQYMNTGTVTADFTDDGNTTGQATDQDASHHFGLEEADNIDIEKFTNGVDADDFVDAPEIIPGATVTWTYEVTTDGPGFIPGGDIEIVDDAGTPGDMGDDFNPAPVLSGGFNVGDTDMDGLLDPDETWRYTASAVAQDLSVVLDFETDGLGTPLSAGTFIDNEYVNFGLTISTDTAWDAMIFDSFHPTGEDDDLGAPNVTFGGPGIGSGGQVGMPGANSARLDNILIISEDGDQYDPDDNAAGGTITFEWDVPVRVDAVSLLDIDSDEPGGTIVTFDDGGAMIATHNLQNLSNNSFQQVEIDDEQVARMEVNLPSSGAIAEVLFDRVFENIGSVEADGVSASDPSHYRNPPKDASIGDLVWNDLNEDGIQDFGEPGVAGVGVTLDGAGVDQMFGTSDDIQEMTVTDSNGNYVFDNLPVGDYKITFEEPAGSTLTLQNQGTDDALDSDADPVTGMTAVISLSAGEQKDSVDAGLVQTIRKVPRYINFEQDADENHLYAGNLIQDQWADWGVHITTSDPVNHPAMLFNSGSPTGGDWDLKTPGSGVNNTLARGLILIISEDADQYDPDDNANGGQLIFDFDQEAIVERVGILDIESGEADGTIETFDASGTLLSTTPLQGLGDNSFQDLVVGQQGVRRMVITFTGSSAVTHIDFQQCVHPNRGAIVQDGNGLVSIDAADYDMHIGRNGYQFQQLELAGDTGAGAMITANHGVNNNTGYAANSPELQYRVKFSQTGTHYVWVRGIGATYSDDSIHVGLNGQELASADRITGFNANWKWAQWTMDGPRATLSVAQTGEQTVNVWMREDGFQFDKLIITADPNYVPAGDGAAVSERATISTVLLEAEDYSTLDSPWQEFTDSEIGRVYLEAPNGTGTHFDNPPVDKELVYEFTISEDGEYQILASVDGANTGDNSFWVKVDDGSWVLWDVEVTGNGFNWQAVNDRNGPPQALFNLTSGSHQLHVKVREDGTKIDRMVITNDLNVDLQTLYATVNMEAENYTSAQSPWTVQDGYVVADNGTGSNYDGPPVGDEITYDFNLSRGGAYYILGLVNGPNGADDSFWVAVDDGEWILWDVSKSTTGFEWDYVSERNGPDQVLFNLSAGNHTLRIKVREDGTMLDKIVITEDPDYSP